MAREQLVGPAILKTDQRLRRDASANLILCGKGRARCISPLKPALDLGQGSVNRYQETCDAVSRQLIARQIGHDDLMGERDAQD